MDSEMYPEGESSNTTAPEREDDGEETALLSKSFLGGKCKPGEKYEIEVVSDLEDEAEVKIVKKESKSEEEPEKSRMAMAGEKLDSMDYS